MDQPQRTPTAQTGGRAPDPGLSASARRLKTATAAATPHARKAIDVYKDRRAAIFNTPGRMRPRRASRGPDRQKDAPFDALRHLSRKLAPVSQKPITSSSPGSVARRASRLGRDSSSSQNDFLSDPIGRSGGLADDDDDEDHAGFLRRRPRMSLPLDADDGDVDLERPRMSDLGDENLTVLSVEQPRRAVSEQPWSRRDRESMRMSDFFGQNDFTGEFNFDGADVPPPFNLGDDDGGEYEGPRPEDTTLVRLDSSPGQRETMAVGRQSDFGTIEVPLDVDSPFRFDPQLQEEESNLEVPELGFDDQTAESSQLGRPSGLGGADGAQEEDLRDDDDDVDVGAGFDMMDDRSDLDLMDDEDGADHELQPNAAAAGGTDATKKKRKRSGAAARYKVSDPCLPPAVVKRLAQTLASTSGVRNTKISEDTLQALMLASDWFFEQLGDDLQAFARHAGRKTIDESDVAMIMRRQRQTSSQSTIFSLAQRHLPRELLQEIRMPLKASPKKRRKTGVTAGGEMGGEE